MKVDIKHRIYAVLAIGFVISLSYLWLFRFLEEYCLPTAIYSVEIIKNGKLLDEASIQSIYRGFWAHAINVELSFPLPSLFVSLFSLITNISLEFIPYIPINILGSIIYFILARRILCEKGYDSYCLFLSVAYYIFSSFSIIGIGYFGRASTGYSVFLPFFLFSYLTMLRKSIVKEDYRSWIMLSILFTLAIGLTYYISLSSIMMSTIATIILFKLITFFTGNKVKYPGFAISITAIALFIYNPFIMAYIHNRPIVYEIINFVTRMLTFESMYFRVQQSVNLPAYYDPLSYMLKQLIFIIRIISILAVPIAIIIYKPKKKQRQFNTIWLFSVIVLLLSISESICYRGFSPRFLTTYGLLVLLYMIRNCIHFLSNKNLIETTSKSLFRRLFSLSIILIFLLSSYGLIRINFYYGHDPLIWYKVHPVSKVISIFSSETLITITGDLSVITQIQYIASLNNGVEKTNIATEILAQDLLTLHQAISTGHAEVFIKNMHKRNISYLLLVNSERPVKASGEWTDVAVIPIDQSMQALPIADIVYYDGISLLFELP
jgi:hypothetical protein